MNLFERVLTIRDWIAKGRITSTLYDYERRVSVGPASLTIPPMQDSIYRSLISRMRPDNITQEDAAYAYEMSATLFGCVRWIADAAISVPFHMRRKQRNGKTIDADNNSFRQLVEWVNPYMSEFDLWDLTFTGCLVQGNHLWVFEEDDESPVGLSIYPVPGNFFRPVYGSRGIVGYMVRFGTTNLAFKSEECIHFKTSSILDHGIGLSPVVPLSLPVSTDLHSQRYNRAFFDNGGRVEMIIEQSGDSGFNAYGDEEVARFLDQWKERYEGSKKAHKIAVLWPGMSIKQLGYAPKDAEYIMQRRVTKEDICAVYGMFPILLGGSGVGAEYRDAEAVVWRSTVLPWHRRICAPINKRLRMMDSLTLSRLVGTFDVRAVPALRREDLDRARVDVALVNTGIRTINEVRDDRGLEHVPWGDVPPPRWAGGSGSGDSSPSLTLPGTEGGRDQTDDGEAQMPDETGQRGLINSDWLTDDDVHEILHG